ncbi:flavodoxin family protein, partial [bacterium]|nr:flavodoxin family protein [bacterium]
AIYPKLTNKTFYYIMTMAETDRKTFKTSTAPLKGFLDCYEGSKVAGKILADGVYEKGAVKETKFMGAAYKLGRSV